MNAAATYLLNVHVLPVARTATVLGELLGAPVSPGSITTWQERGGADLAAPGGFLETVRDGLRAASVLHADETGLRTDGALASVHVAATLALSPGAPPACGEVTVHVGDGRRGKTAIENAGVIDHLSVDAVLVTVPREREVPPAWGPYLFYAMLHALCGAHVIRELRAVAEAAPAPTTDLGSQSWARKMLHLLEWLDTDVAPPPGGWPAAPRRPKAVNLLLRIERHRGDYLRFTSDFTVPFTNNQAERDLRGVRLREKVSGCLRTLHGARAFVAIRWGHLPLAGDYLATAAKQGADALTVLRALHEGRPWIPAITTS